MSRLGPRGHASYGAFVVHRLSGVLLTLFLPLHLWVLGAAIESEARLASRLNWAEQPLVKAAECALIVLLAAHLAGGIRLLGLEFLGWRPRAKTIVAASGGVACAAGLLFLFNAGI